VWKGWSGNFLIEMKLIVTKRYYLLFCKAALHIQIQNYRQISAQFYLSSVCTSSAILTAYSKDANLFASPSLSSRHVLSEVYIRYFYDVSCSDWPGALAEAPSQSLHDTSYKILILRTRSDGTRVTQKRTNWRPWSRLSE
jgi:hypothetical protein